MSETHGCTLPVLVLAAEACLHAPLDALGGYRLPVLIQPLYLKDALGSASAYADDTYRWVEAGAIRVTDP